MKLDIITKFGLVELITFFISIEYGEMKQWVFAEGRLKESVFTSYGKRNYAYSQSAENDLKLEYLVKFVLIFKTNLGCES
jgi:hypothetical protein